MDCSPLGSSIHGIVQGRILEWVAISLSSGSSQPRNWTWVSCIACKFFTSWATREEMILAPIKIQWKIHVRVCFWAVSFILLLYVYSYANATLSWSLSYILKSGNVCSPNLFFIKIVLAVVPDISISAKKGSAIGPSNSVQFSRSVVSDCLRSHESRHIRPPCPSPAPGVHWNSRP